MLANPDTLYTNEHVCWQWNGSIYVHHLDIVKSQSEEKYIILYVGSLLLFCKIENDLVGLNYCRNEIKNNRMNF